MFRGFTLLEFLVALFISAVLLAVSLSNVERFYHHYKLKQLAVELKSFFVQVRSEALSRRQDLWVHFSVVEDSSLNGWKLSLLTSNRIEESNYDEIIQLKGQGVRLSSSWETIKFDGRTGRVLENSYLLFSSGSKKNPSLKLISHHITGRVRICAVDVKFYVYPIC